MAFVGLLGGLVSAVGSLAAGGAQANMANYQAQVAQNNAKIQLQNATYAAEAGEVQEQDTSQKGASTDAAIKTAIAANNVDVNTGSAVNVETSAREQGQLNTLRTGQNAQLQVYGYRAAATNDQAQAGLYQEEAEQAPIGAAFGATGGLLSSVAKIPNIGTLFPSGG